MTLLYFQNINSNVKTKTYLDTVHKDFCSIVKIDDENLNIPTVFSMEQAVLP